MCEHCDQIRMQAGLLLNLTFHNQSRQDIMQTIACIYSALKHEAISTGKEDKFDIFWEDMLKNEFQYLASVCPIEPKNFKENYDIFKHVKK